MAPFTVNNKKLIKRRPRRRRKLVPFVRSSPMRLKQVLVVNKQVTKALRISAAAVDSSDDEEIKKNNDQVLIPCTLITKLDGSAMQQLDNGSFDESKLDRVGGIPSPASSTSAKPSSCSETTRDEAIQEYSEDSESDCSEEEEEKPPHGYRCVIQ